MEAWPAVAGAAGLLLCFAVYVVADVLGEAVMRHAEEEVMRRPSFAARRRHHRTLMKSGYLSAVLAAFAAFVWVAVVTNGRNDNQDDARMFAWLSFGLAVLAGVLLGAWWRLAGKYGQRR
jgi:Na+/proline symporter